jgi:glycosyltransferase involved in cell wall biosynthesis
VALKEFSKCEVGVLTSSSSVEGCGKKEYTIYAAMEQWSFSEVGKFILTVNNFKPDIIHIQYPTQGYGNKLLPWLIPFIGFLLHIKIVQTWHEIYGPRQMFRFFWMGIVPGGLIVVRPKYVNNLSHWLRWGLKNKVIRFIRNASSIPRASLSIDQAKKLKEHYLKGQKRLITFFGFIYPAKGVELLFDIADPLKDQIIICGANPEMGEYQKSVYVKSNCLPWTGKVSITGELPGEEVAKLLAVSDAVILPFKSGGGDWNTSIHSAQAQGTFVITTSNSASGYDKLTNTYYASIDDVKEMKNALEKYCGKKNIEYGDIDATWRSISNEHLDLYRLLVNK